MFAITYKTKKGGSGVMTSTDFEEIRKKAFHLCKQKLEATIYKGRRFLRGRFYFKIEVVTVIR